MATPIPISTDALERALDASLDRLGPTLQRSLVDMWVALGISLDSGALRASVRAGQVSSALETQVAGGLERWRSGFLTGWIQDVLQGGVDLINGALAELGEPLPQTAPRTLAETRSQFLAEHLTETATESMQTAIEEHDRRGTFTEDETAQFMRDVVGVHPPNVRALASQHEALLRDDTPRRTAQERVQRQARDRTQNRANRVVEQETSEAHHNGMEDTLDTWGEAQEIEQIWRVWHTRLDERVDCKICKGLHGKRVKMDRDTSFGILDVFKRELVSPPAHPHCRCVTRYEFDRGSQGTTTTPT